jgi:hypothetical protein
LWETRRLKHWAFVLSRRLISESTALVSFSSSTATNVFIRLFSLFGDPISVRRTESHGGGAWH